jgi:hypothetical protein
MIAMEDAPFSAVAEHGAFLTHTSLIDGREIHEPT